MRNLRISFTVQENDAGGILADLADRVQNLDFGVINDVPHTKNAPRVLKRGNGVSVSSVILEACKHPKKTEELKALLKKAGFSPGSLNNAVFKLRESKQLKNIAMGTYITTGE